MEERGQEVGAGRQRVDAGVIEIALPVPNMRDDGRVSNGDNAQDIRGATAADQNPTAQCSSI